MVVNNGREAARDVEIVVSDVYRANDDGTFELLPEFLPASLPWTYAKSLRLSYLSRGDHRLADFGILHHWTDTGHREFRLETGTDRDFEKGVYAVRLAALGSNCKPCRLLLLVTIGPHILPSAPKSPNTFSIMVAPARLCFSDHVTGSSRIRTNSDT
jgi:hypothetical protein